MRAVVHHKARAMRWKRDLNPFVDGEWRLRERDALTRRRTEFVVRPDWWNRPDQERINLLGKLNGFLDTNLSKILEAL